MQIGSFFEALRCTGLGSSIRENADFSVKIDENGGMDTLVGDSSGEHEMSGDAAVNKHGKSGLTASQATCGQALPLIAPIKGLFNRLGGI